MEAPTTSTTGDDLNPMELRLLAWVCGDASPAEAAELERLTAAHPEWAEVHRQLQGVGDLLAEAAGRDPEPLRLSPRRRSRLLRNLMPRKNILISFAAAVSLIAGVAVYGERTHYVAPPGPDHNLLAQAHHPADVRARSRRRTGTPPRATGRPPGPAAAR